MLEPFASEQDAYVFGLSVTMGNLLRASSRIRTYLRAAGYPETIQNPADDLIELTCQIAARLGATPAELAGGVQTQGVGPFSVGFGWDAWKAQSGLAAGELLTLKQMFPRVPRSLSMGSPSGPNPSAD